MKALRPRDLAPDGLDLPFWNACLEHRFLLHRCEVCGRSYWPASTCVDHGGAAMNWVDATGRGEVHTFTVVHHVYDQSMVDKVPYVVAVVQLDEGPFFHTDIVECRPADVHIGMRVEVTFDDVDTDTVIPRFAKERS
jgi:uncharacterized OB-fold protein